MTPSDHYKPTKRLAYRLTTVFFLVLLCFVWVSVWQFDWFFNSL